MVLRSATVEQASSCEENPPRTNDQDEYDLSAPRPCTTPGRTRTCDLRIRNPHINNAKGFIDKELTQPPENDLASFLAHIVKNHPELVNLIEAWPDLSPELRVGIVKMVSK
jgi:hypothetical protein